MSYSEIKEQLLDFASMFEPMQLENFDFQFDIEQKEHCLNIGINNMGTTIVAVEDNSQGKVQYLFVWLDGEAAFNLAFADSVSQFIQLFPYINGLVYDMLFDWNLYHKFSEIFPDPVKKFTNKICSKYLKENIREYPFLTRCIDYQKQKFEQPYQENPYQAILRVLDTNKDFNDWHDKFIN